MKEIEMLGSRVTLEVSEKASTMDDKGEEMVLCVKNLPTKIPSKHIQSSLEKYLKRHTDKVIKTCVVNEGIGYVAFEDPTGIFYIFNIPKLLRLYIITNKLLIVR